MRSTSSTTHFSISIHALREEGDTSRRHVRVLCGDFYPRPPRGGRPCALPLSWLHSPISIHALREEGDLSARLRTYGRLDISIHALREEGDRGCPDGPADYFYFYPRPPRGGRLAALSWSTPSWGVLSTPSARRATFSLSSNGTVNLFLSTPSARRATRPQHFQGHPTAISIHALREEGDDLSWFPPPDIQYFYPRPPRGGRQQKQRQNLYFQTNYTTFCTNLEEP